MKLGMNIGIRLTCPLIWSDAFPAGKCSFQMDPSQEIAHAQGHVSKPRSDTHRRSLDG